MNYLFIDTISDIWKLMIFNENKKIISFKNIEIKWSEYSSLLNEIINYLDECGLNLDNISWIITINWPGWFTWTRILALILNTINYVKKIPLESINFWEYVILCWWEYPILIKANRWEYLLKENKNTEPKLIKNEEIKEWEYFWIWDLDFDKTKIKIKSQLDISKFIENYNPSYNNKKIEPYYIKKPNIT